MKLQPTQISLDGFRAAFAQGLAGIETAAYILAALIDRDGPKVYKQIMAAEPRCPLNLIANLERVGRGVIPMELLYDSSPAASKIKLLPPAQQKECYAKPVMVVQLDKGKKVMVEKPVKDLTPKECQIVFSGNKINDAKEQSKLLDAVKPSEKTKPAQRYEILPSGNLVVHFAETEFTPSQLEDIYNRVKERAIKSLKK